MLLVCPNCGERNAERYRLCGQCGTQLSPDRPIEEIRRFVTVVTSDLKGSTALGEKLDPESLREVLTRYFDEMRVVFESRGGTIEKIIGDAIIAVFGLPVRRDDDAVRAVEAAAESVRVLTELNDQLEIEWGVRLITRTGVATGDVVVGEATAGQHVLTGDTMKYATAMEQNAPSLEVLIAHSTYELVRDVVTVEPMGRHTPKGMDQATLAYRLISVTRRAPSSDGKAPAPLPRADLALCYTCGEENPTGARLCGMCGVPLAEHRKVQETRKTVSIVFADPKPATATGEPPSAEALRDVMSRYFEEMRRVLEGHGGTVEKFIGDAVMAVFGLPVRHEDDALRAVRAALDMQAALPPLNENFKATWGVELLNHIGVNTGEVVAGDASLGQRLVTGDAVNVSARLEQAAHAREVLIGPLTYNLVRDAVDVEAVEPLTLKGKSEPVPAYRLIAVRADEQVTRKLDAPMVGREAELAVLRSSLREADGTRACRMITVFGDAGVGKTRLTREFLSGVARESLVVKGRCLPYGDGITFWPMVEIVRKAAAIRDDDPPEQARARIERVVGEEDRPIADRIASVVGLSTATYQVAELFWAIRRFFEILAREEPLVVVFDDIHWAEQTFLDLIGHLTAATTDAPVLLLCTARNELLEAHPDWAEAPGQARIVLTPLTDPESELVVRNLLGGVGLAEEVSSRIVAAAEGNPLFVEQLFSMLVDGGKLTFADGAWKPTGSLSEIAIPPTIHALVASRLDSLPYEERSVVEPASVIGLTFGQDAVKELVDETVTDEVPARLESLARKEMVRSTSSSATGSDSYRFQHLVIRDAAYQGLLKRSRAILHERFVRWADRVNAEQDRALEFEEILGYHLEQAYRYRSELGPLDEHGVGLGLRASERLASAGNRALARGDLHAATGLLTRAAAVLPTDHPDRPRILLTAGGAHMESGEFGTADAAFGDAIETATAIGDQALALTIEIERLNLHYLTGTAGPDEQVLERVRSAIAALEAAGADDGLARAYRLLGSVELRAGRWAATERAAALQIEHAGRAGNTLMQARSLPNLAMLAVYAPTPVNQGIERCEALLPRVASDRRATATVLSSLARLHAMVGDFDRARDEYQQARRTYVELGWNFDAATVSLEASGPIEILAGDAAAAERELRRDHEALERMGDRNWTPATGGLLALALVEQGRHQDADAFARFSEENASLDDVFTQILWRRARARILAAAGDAVGAASLAERAVELARTSDDPTQLADTLMTLAEVLRLTGREGETFPAVAEARALYEAKGNVVSAARATSQLAEHEVSTPLG